MEEMAIVIISSALVSRIKWWIKMWLICLRISRREELSHRCHYWGGVTKSKQTRVSIAPPFIAPPFLAEERRAGEGGYGIRRRLGLFFCVCACVWKRVSCVFCFCIRVWRVRDFVCVVCCVGVVRRLGCRSIVLWLFLRVPFCLFFSSKNRWWDTVVRRPRVHIIW